MFSIVIPAACQFSVQLFVHHPRQLEQHRSGSLESNRGQCRIFVFGKRLLINKYQVSCGLVAVEKPLTSLDTLS